MGKVKSSDYTSVSRTMDLHIEQSVIENIKNLNKEHFINALRNVLLYSVFVFEECDDIVDVWYTIFNSIIDEFLPQKQKRVKRRVQPKWFNADINQAIKSCDKLLKKERKSQEEADYNAFKRAKKYCYQGN